MTILVHDIDKQRLRDTARQASIAKPGLDLHLQAMAELNALLPPNVVLALLNEIYQLKAENAELRRIVSECATACGAGVSPECSLAFMAGLPREIELAMTKEQP